ncbi:MAG TPA: hydroxymethylglutaryl-CoA synthase family protein [Cytophagales bacterium]|nr:hydroxymethylglutaryl-CoA synthase family protein [Cytophagales bacterium]
MAEVGIDDIAIHFPRLYFDMKDFAKLRGTDFGKLNRGLGLSAMSIPDVHEDTATMGANAVSRLIDRNDLDPSSIGRIYLGTESALDGAKPTATYIMDMLEQRYAPTYGDDCFRNCDVVDPTFACIGAVDAMHNTLDWSARGGEERNRIGIVVFADNAKYDLGSSGEYTQGAGGGAILISHNPRLLIIPDIWGVSTMPVHDFFKPRREVDTRTVIENVLDLARESGESIQTKNDVLFENEKLMIHKDTPVFDGQFSNRCYSESVKQAFIDFRSKSIAEGRYDPKTDEILTNQWSRIIVHLPYAFQGKRMFPDVFRHDRRHLPMWEKITDEIGQEPLPGDFPDTPKGLEEFESANDVYRRRISKTEEFLLFVDERIEKTQRASSLIGNQYTGSIFLALMSAMESDYIDNTEMSGRRIGLCGYGSGAKAKVFEGIVQQQWREIASGFHLFDRLSTRHAINKTVYEALHKGKRKRSVVKPNGEFALVGIGGEGQLEGQRRYEWFA